MANENLIKGRVVYQNFMIEILLLTSVLVHMFSNTMLYLYRKRNDKKDNTTNTPSELKAHRIAGYIMGFSILGHVAATRLAPLYILSSPSIYDYGFVHTAAKLLGGTPFYIYLAIFAMAAGWHVVYGTRSALATLSGTSISNKPFPMALKLLALTNHILIILAILALSGYFYPIEIPPAKVEEQDKLFAVMGI